MLPLVDGRVAVTGRVGAGRTVAEGAYAARLCAIQALAAIAACLGGGAEALARVVRVEQVVGHVLCAPDCTAQPAVLNGASTFLVEVFGDRGRHTRLALGAHALPLDATVELAMVVRVAPR